MAYTDISPLFGKKNNPEMSESTSDIPNDQKLTANEFVDMIATPIKELQEAVGKSVKKIVRGSVSYEPVDGVITFPSEAASVSIVAEESTESYVETSGKVVLHIRITSVDGGADTGNMVNVEVQRFVNNDYNTVMTKKMQSKPMSSTGWDELDITDILADGANQIRIVATDSETLAVGRLAFSSIVKASLSVEPLFDWSRPVTETGNGIALSYAVLGTGVDKTVHIRVYDNAQNQHRDFTELIGKATFSRSTPYERTVNDVPSETVIMSHGVHTIEAWVTCTSNGQTFSSKHIKNQIMVVADSTNPKQYLMFQQTQGMDADSTSYLHADNYVQNDRFFAFAVYSPDGSDVSVTFSADDYDGTTNYMRFEQLASVNTPYTVPAAIMIEDAVVGQEYYAYLTAKDGSGEDILSISGDRIIILVENKYNFAPTSGADFHIKPSSRNNNEEHPDRILNAAKGNAVIESVFDGFNFDANDGWVLAEDKQRVLRILAGQKLTIIYDIFDELRRNPRANVHIEFDMKVRNVTNEKEPIINISNPVASDENKFIGMQMCPLEGCVMTTSQSVYGQQNFGWREDVRTHIAINICSAIYADDTDNTIPLVRVFVNSNPYREFIWKLETDEWGRNVTRIEIGQSGAEIDIYDLAVYKKAIYAQNIMQNYLASLPTTAERLAFSDANDILDANGHISYEKAREKYSCIVHHGRPASIEHPESTTCWLEISHMVDGKYDAATSGTICKDTKMCPVKGQGSTAKGYADWNQQYDPKKAVLPDDDFTTPYIEKTSDGKTTRLPAIMVNGDLKQDGWIDGNGKYKGTYYQLSPTDANAEKLVGKINYASSMQSHKMGATAAYNDLYRAVMGDDLDTIMTNKSNARCAVKEDMFLFFVQEEDESEPHYEGVMTFGAGKMDKKTWGVGDSEIEAGFGMFEGSDNGTPVTNFERPWNDDVTYNPDEEYYEYNGNGNIDFDVGATVKVGDKEYPTGKAVEVMKNFVNFGYRYCTDILPWATSGGTVASLIAAANTDADIHKQYWITQASQDAARGDLYSWSPLAGTWVKAGINEETRNVFEENPDVVFSGDYDAVNKALIKSILVRFVANGKNYYNVRSKLFHSCFVENLLAGSDNCAKNTYYVIDILLLIVVFHADDLDTIFKTDNKSFQTKPYYVDRVHHVDEEGNETYSGTHNMFFNTFDRAYEDGEYSVELNKQTMMRDIFRAMVSLGGSVKGFFEKYFFSIQRNIPAIAYVEQARIRYERRQIQVNNDEISVTVAPIAQQQGSQLESELQYMDRRLVYFQSFAAYGEFAVGEGGNKLSFRGYPQRNGQGARIAFTIKPHQYIYPTAAFGQTLVDPHVRLSPHDTYEIVVSNSVGDDTLCALNGIDYYAEIGNIGNLSVNPGDSFSIGGKRLTKVEAYTDDGVGEFRPASLAITASLVEEVRVNVQDVGSNLDLTKLTRLRTADLRGTSLNKVDIPSTRTLTSVQLGDKISSIALAGLPNLVVFTIGNCQYLSEFQIGKNVSQDIDSMAIVQKAFADGADLQYISIENIKWGNQELNTGLTARTVEWLSNADYAHITGSIHIVDALDAQRKQMLMHKFGNIDDRNNPLYITYRQVRVTSISIAGPIQISKPGAYRLTIETAPLNANAFVSLKWTMDASSYATLDGSGLLTVTSVADEDIAQPIARIKCELTNTDGSVITAYHTVYLYNRKPKVGDFAYADGTFDSELHVGKAVVGWVFKIDKETYNDKPALKCLVQAADERVRISVPNLTLDTLPWGLRDGTSSVGNDVLDDIAAKLGVGNRNNVIDIPAIANIFQNGLRNEAGTGTQSQIRHFNAYDFNQPDGFAVLPETSGHGDMNGKVKTKLIIDHANNILTRYVPDMREGSTSGKTVSDYISSQSIIPTNITELGELMYALEKVGGNANYRQMCYPAAYACYVYEPKATDLHQQYKAGNWYLPSEGELVRLYIFHRNSKTQDPTASSTTADSGSYQPSMTYANDNPSYEALLPAYSNMQKKASDKGVICPVSNNNQAITWSAAEGSSTNSWNVNFSDGNASNYTKSNSTVVRPVTAFYFEL